ncbi:C-C motif chemokine 4-like [Halichoeres trimaculatus]|uniref:C-C motif chemokine 4-like n=1 Tax=Halichoeres trimaculatus TaxID=147232 RepID=UPI003D9E3C18
MKTLCFTLGLLLFIACYCHAIPEALSNTAPGQCCFDFSVRPIPIKFVKTITKTHRSCEDQAFIVQTNRGQTCFEQSFPWAQRAYRRIQNKESSGM